MITYKEKLDELNEKYSATGLTPFSAINNINSKFALQKLYKFYEGISAKNPAIVKAIGAVKEYLSISPIQENAYEKESVALAKVLADDIVFSSLWYFYDLANGVLPIEYTNEYEYGALKELMEYYNGNFVPAFTHEPVMTDIAPELAESSPLFIGLANVARLYPYKLKETIAFNEEIKFVVQLWKFGMDGYEPQNVVLDKSTLALKKICMAKNKGLALWPILFEEALQQAGIDVENTSTGQLMEYCFGPDFTYDDLTYRVEDTLSFFYNGKNFEDFIEWTKSGYLMTIKSNGFSSALPKGNYILMGAYEEKVEGVGYKQLVRLYNPGNTKLNVQAQSAITMEYEDFLKSCEGFDMNRSGALKGMDHVSIKGFDVNTKAEFEQYEAHAVNDSNYSAYLKCAYDLYVAFNKAKVAEETPKEYKYMLFLAEELVTKAAMSYGSNDEIIGHVLRPMMDCSKKYRELVGEPISEMDIDRVNACLTCEKLAELYLEKGDMPFNPIEEFQKIFIKKFATKIANDVNFFYVDWYVDNELKELSNDALFKETISKVSIVTLLNADNDQMEKIENKYFEKKLTSN